MAPPLLVTITFSHYCEKARWCLDRAGIAYREAGHLPIFHIPSVRRAGGKRSVPVLVTDEGVLSDSTDIAKWADARANGAHLYGKTDAERREIERLEDHFDEGLGPHARRWVYHHLLPDRALTLRVMDMQDVPALEKRLLPLGFPLARALMRRAMRITKEGAARSLDKIDAMFDEVGKTLADGRPFLVGDSLSMADITFASLAAVVVSPLEYGAPLPSADELPAEAASRVRGFTDHPAGQYVLRVFRDHRRAK